MQISFSASKYHREYHREYHFVNIILKTENRARRHRTETQRIFAHGSCLFIISEWAPVSDELLLFLWIKFNVMGQLIDLESVGITNRYSY